MAEKRKDHKGRILKTGESQRKDLLYQYRYTDSLGIRRTIYDSDLSELREKERIVLRDIEDGIKYHEGTIPVLDLVKRYIDLKQGVRYQTKAVYTTVYNLLKEDPFGGQELNKITPSDAKLWILQLHHGGKKYNTLSSIKGVLQPAFQMAVDEDIIRKNPFKFKLSDIVARDAQRRDALTLEEQRIWLEYLRNDTIYFKYYHEFIILLDTGMRVSEMCGLTIDDVDFEHRRISVNHQLLRESSGTYYIEHPKTASGTRFIPMTRRVYESLIYVVSNRMLQSSEPNIDGYTGFLFLTQRGKPKIAINVEAVLRKCMMRYHKLHPSRPLPSITPHVLRHTFCTNMINAGMDVKTVQYLMGHSDINMTLNLYAHANYDNAATQMEQFSSFGHISGTNRMISNVSSTTPFTTPFTQKLTETCVDL